jgi:CBS domain containing-hemolysin-like protein
MSAIRLTRYARLLMAITAILTVPMGLTGEGQAGAEPGSAVTQDDLMILVEAGEEEGVFEKEEREMINSIFDLGDTLAREIMVPRIDMLSFDVDTPLSEAVDAILKAGYSRVPVHAESVDNMIGLLYAKDLLRVWREENIDATLRGLVRPAYFVPEGKKLDELLAEMQSQRIHMAIVVDEYGGVAGLVTLEDIVEEIFGEILDEYDVGEEAPYQQLADGSYVFLGRIGLDDFNEIMGSSLTSEDTDTLGGYIYGCLEHVPAVGETVREGDLLLTVEQVSARRIRKVSARWAPVEEQKKEEQEGVDGSAT